MKIAEMPTGMLAPVSASKVTSGVMVPDGPREAPIGPFTHYPKHPTADDVYFIAGAWAPAAITAVDKRFTDAELAAEWWAACLGFEHDPQAMTFRRFATLPHHDEEDA